MNFMVMFYNVCKGEISYHIRFKTVEFGFSLNGKCSLKCQTNHLRDLLDVICIHTWQRVRAIFVVVVIIIIIIIKTGGPSTPIYPVSFTQNFVKS